ncbi:VOC family protein [Cytophagaceae bacterium ABcell3]|nr:VOC family protein [Cytophagaceae bacterium ABcell3]
MTHIVPYLTFDGNCREAMNFYKSCLGGEVRFQTIAETDFADRCPAGMQQQIMHSELIVDHARLMASDMVQPEGLKPGNDMAISLDLDSEKNTKSIFEELSVGGTVIEPLKKAFGNALFGVLKDKYNKVWMFHCEL